jgi:NDP-sugar pyrophosphorylase family protein/aminoglycoside/choline kinase family phosphotransferase
LIKPEKESSLNLSAFILAAGLGERLQPITHHIPKPLLPILGKPVLQCVLERIMALPIHKIGINLHYKKQIIEDWIKHSGYFENITLFIEDPILGTGGALINAEVFLKKSPFLVHNSDILSDIDLEKLIECHVSSGNLATLAVHDYPEFNRLILDKNGLFKDIVKHPHPYPPPSRGREVEESAPSSGGRGLGGGGIESKTFAAFTGIAMYQPEFLQFLPPGNSSVVDAWFRALSAGYRIGTLDVTGCYWTDIGTPSAYAQAVTHELRKNGENVYMHQSVKGCMHAELDGYVVIEKDNVLNQGVTLRNCISLPGTTIGKTSDDESSPECFLTLFWGTRGNSIEKKVFEHCVLGPDFTVKLSESDFYTTNNHDTFLIGTGGSDRKYFRVKQNHCSAVLMQCAENDPDFQRHIEYTTFFRTYAVPVPELITAEPHNKTAIFEDLGDLSLYSWLKCSRTADQVEEMYRKVLDILIPIHTAATGHVHECPLLKTRIFDYEYLRWETTYFLEQFVEGIKNRKVDNTTSLQDEFHKLAIVVDSFPKTIVHRDFQSQNIMITKGGIPRILDYQGARIGPPAYDIVSVLWDPYYRLEDDVRERLLDFYIDKVIPPHPPLEKGGNNFSHTKETIIRDKFSPFTKGGSKGMAHLHGKNTASSKYPPFSKGGQGGITENEFRGTVLPCRLQRHMQALGAYGFLARVKGKKYFMNHIPEGIRLLKEDISQSGNDYPILHRLIMEL